MSDIRQLILRDEPFPEIEFVNSSMDIGSVGNYHYIEVGLDGTGTPSASCRNTAPPTFLASVQYSQSLLPAYVPRWFGGSSTLLDDALSGFYEWKIDDLSNMTYIDGTASVGTWYPFSLTGKTARLQYLGGSPGYYRIYFRRVGETGASQVRYNISP